MWFNSSNNNNISSSGNNNSPTTTHLLPTNNTSKGTDNQASMSRLKAGPVDGQQVSNSVSSSSAINLAANNNVESSTNKSSSTNKTLPSVHHAQSAASSIQTFISNTIPSVQQLLSLYQTSDQIPGKISFHLKTSIFIRRVTIDSEKMALGFIKQLAVAFLNELYFQNQYPANTFIGDYIRKQFGHPDNIRTLYDRIVLRKYNCIEESFLPFNCVSDIEPESYICIEISEKQPAHPLGGSTSATHNATSSSSVSHISMPSTGSSSNQSGLQMSPSGCNQQQTTDNLQMPQISTPQPDSQSSQKTGQDSVQNANNATGANKLGSAHPNMSKRKSTSNLLHFNIANPFKSHHASQQQHQQQPAPATGSPQVTKDQGKHKFRSSTGALDPFLQQLGKLKEQQQLTPAPAATTNPGQRVPGKDRNESSTNNLLMVSQNVHLSSSHQNLFTDDKNQFDGLSSAAGGGGSKANDVLMAGSLSVHQSPTNRAAHTSQLSNSARTSVLDLHGATSPTGKTRDHLFISMDWIQINGEPLCGVCNKILANQQQHLQQQQTSLASNCPPVMCRNCKLQVHAHCQDLVLNDCLSRIAESSRAAAERQDSGISQAGDTKQGVNNTNSNVSRDNIRLRRLVPSVKHVKRPDSTKPIIEGWLKHTTLSDEQARQHYWRLDETDITLYENDTSRRYFKAIALDKITRVVSSQSLPKRVKEDVLTTTSRAPEIQGCSMGDKQQQMTKSANTSPMKSPELQAQMNAIFGFELASGSMYLVKANNENEASRWMESLATITAQRQQKRSEPAPVAPTTGPPMLGTDNKQVAKQGEPVSTVRKLVESVNEICLDKERDANSATTNGQQLLGKTIAADKHEVDNNNKLHQTAPVMDSKQQAPPVAVTSPMVKQSDKQVATAVAAPNAKQPPAMQRQHHHHYPQGGHLRGQHNKTYTDPARSRLYNRPRKTIQISPMSIPDHWIVGKYLIERDRIKGCGFEELGSGQFGKVYAAISEIKAEDSTRGIWSGVPVAIKEISKARFDLRQQAKLKNEANILSQLDHPGVIILERVHDLSDKIYIVMEQLEDDMLEMIVSTDEKRLNERVTKFLTYQILEALKYLHQKHIAHCDLKPENVLLVERRSQFPQIKLCDFGFAKIIEDNSFRSSLVGTPAYLAPEVVKGERYNRSVDLWSVGVIVYVSLSGEFPFNEGESIHDQISRANFMYPKNPWDGISAQAKNFINSLLRVNCEKRLSASRAQMDDWIQDYQLWCDLTELEVRVGKRWVTDDADFERWSRYAREHNLQLPRSAIQLHENLLAD